MNTGILAVIVFSFLIAITASGQACSPHSIQQAINYDISELKKRIPDRDNIFIITNMDDHIVLPAKVFKIENVLNAKFLNKKDKNYLVEVRVASVHARLSRYHCNHFNQINHRFRQWLASMAGIEFQKYF